MENLKIIYIDDYPETSLSKYLDKYKNSSCNVESLDIKFNPDAGYESLINNPDVKSANIIFIDSKLFENRTAIAGKFTGEEFKIILKKYSPMMELGSFAKQYAESVAQTMNQKVAVSDRDQIIAVAGGGKRELLGKTISRQLEEMIINRENSIQAGLDKKTIPLISGDEDSYSAQAIYPICCEGDCIGAVILYSRENQTHFSETEYKAAACAASFLGKQMEG